MVLPNDSKKEVLLEKTQHGYYQHRPLPSHEELKDWYSQQYYQEGIGGYQVSYSPQELQYFRLKAELIYKKVSRLRNLDRKKRVLDIGCGEGWVLDCFFKKDHTVSGFDFSEFGLKSFNPQLLPFLEQGDCMDLIQQKVDRQEQYDIVILGNVIEHVLDPIMLVSKIKAILAQEGVLVIVAPNDFSLLHDYLLNNNYIDKPFWLSYPEHISYFNKESMENLLKSQGLRVEAVIADNPVDLNLLNKNSNYIQEPEKGRNIHFFRVNTDNFLAEISKDKLLDLYEILGSMGVGRNLTYVCSK